MLNVRLLQWPLKDTWCVVRIDANVDVASLQESERLTASLKTLDYLKKSGARVILLTHIGRPEHFDSRLSTQLLLKWFLAHGFSFDFSSQMPDKNVLQACRSDGIVIENIRMLDISDNAISSWYESVKGMVSYYVNDAWGSIHRRDWSLVFLPSLFAREYRSSGFLISHEIALLNKILAHTGNKYLFLAGGKGEEKIKSIRKSKPFFNRLLLGPLASFYVDLLQTAEFQINVPEDYLVSNSGFLRVEKAISVDKSNVVSIGPGTCRSYINQLKSADWIIINGLMGIDSIPASFEMMELLIRAIAQFPNRKLYCGGDTVSFTQKILSSDQNTYFSTGGGSTLAYLGNQSLAALEIID